MLAPQTVLLGLLALLALCQCMPLNEDATPKKLHRNMIRGRPLKGLKYTPPEGDWIHSRATTQGFFDNLVDHFSNNTATYQQRYWYNDQWYKPGGPAFFMLGGESEESPYWVEASNLAWTQMAADHGAFVFLAEHRFYGGSKPTPDMSTPNLKYLSSAQAIEDYASFITGMKKKFPQLSTAQWVTFGGSYSGALAAWMRVKHPELVSVAVGSSGPVQAEVDFVEYMEVVQASINYTSTSCAASVASGMSQVAQLLQTAAGRQTLKTTFNLCENIDTTNALQLQTFWSTVYSPYMEIVQYSGDNAGIFANTLTINHAICRFHNANVSTMTKMKQVNNYFNDEQGYFGCNSIDYNDFINYAKDISYGEAQDLRAWVWQTCTEFGYYQSTDSATAGPFFGGVQALPVSYYIQQCSDIYGSAYNSAEVAAAVANTNQYYGGRDNMVGTKIVLPNGTIDPWHALGKLNGTSSITPVVITGTAHCADMYGSGPNDLPALTNARQVIASTLTTYLNQQ